MNTLNKDVIFDGVGIHSGKPVKMVVSPSAQSGIRFKYDEEIIRVNIDAIGINHIRSTTLTNGKITIQTPEHFLAACYALKLTNMMVTLNELELPILDGSAIEFIQELQKEVVSVPSEKQEKLRINNDQHFTSNNAHYFTMPSNELNVSVYLSYPDHWIKSMCYVYTHSESAFISDIAPARTYGFTHEIEALKNSGLAKGGSLDNALVVADEGYLNEPRFVDELARHKILDFLGDMSISGKEIVGQFVLIKPSHQGNCELLKQLSI
ncbi:UDP-3-O-[3-hydroxymyristoyl] N-acetylglucosamine deacetylase [Candidatus Marinamargulisbacteria bacterium SCGC AG-343-K17]|nr:UDP-3-O-[3-hydroxymyristoyl] N-acetylglucosamine deacetylase [Candidatus Marinamargulisbacteria bacterium SCGC AG-343-K17]